MTDAEVLDISREALYTLIMVVSPILLVAMIIGLLIGIFQTLTQIQEITLTFVPKIILVFITAIVVLPFMLGRMTGLATNIFDRITAIGIT